jgi:tRNA 2-thiouridine synthesizing protein C
MMNSTLFIFRTPPYGQSTLREGLDMALATAVFDRNVAVLFEQDAVVALCQNQQSDVLDQPSVEKILQSLPIYGIERLMVCSDSLLERSIDQTMLLDDVEPVEDKRKLLSQYDQVMVY